MKFGHILLIIFTILCLINLLGEFQDSRNLVFLTKPLLITTLALWFFTETKSHRSIFSKLIITALIFSVGGDTLLMFVNESPDTQQFFLLGLGSFLLTHLFYIAAFLKYPSKKTGWVRGQKGWGIPFVLFFVGMSGYLFPDIPPAMRVPVIIYSAVIMLMVMSALNMKGKIPDQVFNILFAGALLFMVSDTFIALNKFKTDELSIPQPGLIIMTTYLLGQFLIVKASSKINPTIPDNE